MGNGTKWSEMSAACKVILSLRIFISILVVIMATLQLTGTWDHALNYAIPLVGAVLFLQSVMEWKTNRIAAITGLVCAVFVWVCTVAVWLSL